MPDAPKRVTLEKSRTVRRRYQRSNKRLKFSSSQIARIEREEEREHRAKKLREKEKKRVANKKKKAEKEAKEREERRRLGAPDPLALAIPSSQPLLSRFLKRPVAPAVLEPVKSESPGEDSGLDSPGSGTEDEGEGSCLDESESDDTIIADLEEGFAGLDDSTEFAGVDDGHAKAKAKDDDEFSDCSIFYDEDIIKEAETITTVLDIPQEQGLEKQTDKPATIGLSRGDSFQDDTADLLEEFAHEFDTDEEFEQELARLDAG